MSPSERWYLDVAERIFSGMGARSNPIFNQFVEDTGELEGQDLAFIQVAYGFAPEPVTPQHFIRWSPYGNPEAIKRQMQDAAERGWLDRVGDDQYAATAVARQAAEGLFALADATYGRLQSLPDQDLERILTLLEKVVQRVAELPEPQEKWAFSWGARFDRGSAARLLVRVRRRMLDLLYYRDDAHIAAWQPYAVDGQAWETLTYVWRGEAGTAAELAEKLPYRNYEERAYAAALESLASRGWIAEQEGTYVVTQEGGAVRQAAEDATDHLFDAAWEALDGAEIAELKELLEGLAEAVKPPEEEAM